MTATPPWERHPHGITTIDALYTRPGYASVHVIERGGRAALVDTGTNSSVPHVLAALAALGIDRAQIDLVFVTHVHLDHAGGAGVLLSQLPTARAVVHPRAVQHLVDPTRLIAASRDVYGHERFDALYGVPLGIDSARIVTTTDGDRLRLGESEFVVLHTPGHALHHHVLHDPASASVFTGDTFGLSYRQLDSERGPLVLPTTTPSQFDPDQLLSSIERILSLSPEAAFLTHYGRISGVTRLGAQLKTELVALVEIATSLAASRDREHAIAGAIRERWLDLAQHHGTPLDAAHVIDLLSNDIELNAAGLAIWLDRSVRRPG